MLRTNTRIYTAAAVFALGVALAVPSTARAQAVPDAASAGAVREQFLMDLDSLQKKFVSLAEAIPADKYSWRPAAGVRTVGEVFKHVAGEYYTYAPVSFGATRSPVIPRTKEGFEAFEAASSKEEALKHLREGFAFARGRASPGSMRRHSPGRRRSSGAITRSSRRASASPPTCTSTSAS